MNKLLLILLLGLAQVQAQFGVLDLADPVFIAGTVNEGGPSYVLKDYFDGYDGVTGSTQAYIANKFTAAYTYDLERLSVYIYRNVADTSDYYIAIWSDSAGSPGTSLGSVLVSNANVPASSAAWLEVDLSSAVSISSGTSYWVVTQKATPNSSTLNWGRGNTTVEHMKHSTDGSSWTDLTTTRAGNYKAYALE